MNAQGEQTVHPFNLEQATRRFQRDFIRNILELVCWDMEAAAGMLGVGLDELERKMAFYLIRR